jgi:hypothetical protein
MTTANAMIARKTLTSTKAHRLFLRCPLVSIPVPIGLICGQNYLRKTLSLVAVSDILILVQERDRRWGICYESEQRLSEVGLGNEDSTMVSGNFASSISTDRAGGIVDIQLHRSFAAHYHWIHSSRLRDSGSCDGSEVEATVQAAPGTLGWTGLADRGSDCSRIYHSEHGQSSCRMDPSTGCHGNLRHGDCGNFHVNET